MWQRTNRRTQTAHARASAREPWHIFVYTHQGRWEPQGLRRESGGAGLRRETGKGGARGARQAAHERARAQCRERVALLAQAHPDNVVAVHCKAGKGRTGLVMICYLMYSGFRGSAVKARDFYDWARTTDGKGLTITSQANIM